MTPSDAPRTTFVARVSAGMVASIAFAGIAYLAWYRLAAHLVRWARAAWWHWPLALWLLMVLLVLPFATLLDMRNLAPAAAASARRRLWIVCGFVGRASTIALVLWAFTDRPSWWTGSYWWVWGAAAVGTAVIGAAGWMFLAVQDVGAPVPRSSHASEWLFNHGDTGAPPALGLAMSGGGIRSAAFNVGVLHALHESGILPLVDVMSAVSGGSYAMSWYLLQPYYAAAAAKRAGEPFDLRAVLDEMFDPEGRFQQYLAEDPKIVEYGEFTDVLLDVTVSQPLRAFSATLGNVAGYNGDGAIRLRYREAIQRLFHGHPERSHRGAIGNEITSIELQQMMIFDSGRFCAVTPVRYQDLSQFVLEHRLPFFIFNGAMLVDRAHRHMLWPTAFELTAGDVGSDACGYRPWDDLRHLDVSDDRARQRFTNTAGALGYLFQHGDERRPNRWVFLVNLAPAISGAALGLSYFNPQSTVRQQRLATWTPFMGNVDLGYLFPLDIWNRTGALYVSDGGHSDNLGAYALLKRQCRTMIIVDAEHEAAGPYVFAGYVKLKTQLRAEMQLDLQIPDIDQYLEGARGGPESIRLPPPLAAGLARSTVSAPSTRPMSVVYIKLALDREHLESYPVAVQERARRSPVFPQDPTTNQAFTTEQFVAYRELGRHVASGVQSVIAAL